MEIHSVFNIFSTVALSFFRFQIVLMHKIQKVENKKMQFEK
jgi:hypothetical protein